MRTTSPYLCKVSSTAHGYLPENLEGMSDFKEQIRMLDPELTSDKHTRYWRQLLLEGQEVWRVDGNRENTGIALLRGR